VWHDFGEAVMHLTGQELWPILFSETAQTEEVSAFDIDLDQLRSPLRHREDIGYGATIDFHDTESRRGVRMI
jgi:hypothetical protein